MPDREASATDPVPAREEAPATTTAGWLNRNVVAMGLTSFLSDFGHEMATALLPAFLLTIGAGPAILGTIEGISDTVSSFIKIGAGYSSDRWGHRKAVAVLGYFLTGVAKALFALAQTWPPVPVGRVVGWFGRGIHGPIRDAMLAESVALVARGRAFGFHRAGDTAGAVARPSVALLLIGTLGLRGSFLLTLVPGLLAALLFALLVRDPPQRSLTPALGQGLAATTGVGLNLLRNVLYTLAAFPIGLLSDRFGRRPLLAAGYGLAGLTFAGFAWLPPVIPVLAVLFALAGIFIAAEDTLEGALVADLLGSNRGLGYGILGTVNGVGNLTSSVVVGVLWAAFGVTVCFAYAATFER